MSPVEYEFSQLIQRYAGAKAYEKAKYRSDSPEAKELAIRAFFSIIGRMGELWEQMTDEEKQKYMDMLG